MNWETYSRRRRMSLSSFLEDSATESEAIKKFERKGIDIFPRDEVSKYYEVSPVQSETAKDSIDTLESQITIISEDEVPAPPKSSKVKSGTAST